MTVHATKEIKGSGDSTTKQLAGFSWSAEGSPRYSRDISVSSYFFPKLISSPFNSKTLHLILSLLMAALWGLFAYRHMQAFRSNGEWGYLIVCISETLSATFFIFRSAPVTVSNDPVDWLFAFVGTFTPLLLIPSPWGILPAAKSLIIIGTTLQIMGLISLNRSFALVAAKRQIKTGGMYKLIRHPLYASYFIILLGYALTNTTWFNVSICLITAGFLGSRLAREEKHLTLDKAYVDYAQTVRYRIIPFVY